ncbi:MAG TPA: hypothetical protein VLG69_04800 [Candidatus Andersenbacteria bacterium]|nr:hypothetical protein [Candidatus Andersenbacteria bacterium]
MFTMREKVVYGVAPATNVGLNRWRGLAEVHCKLIMDNNYATSLDLYYVSTGELILLGLCSLPECPHELRLNNKNCVVCFNWGNWAQDAHIAIAEYVGLGNEVIMYYKTIAESLARKSSRTSLEISSVDPYRWSAEEGDPVPNDIDEL